MKLTKKVIAAAAALAMTMTSMTGVLADETIDSSTNYVDTTVYKVTLPTTKGMSFVLDPQGLIGIKENGTQSATSVISGVGVMVAKNESSVDVGFSAKFYVEDSSGTLQLESSDTAVGDTTTKQAVCLQVASQYDSPTASFTTPTSVTSNPMAVTGTALASANAYTVTMGACSYVTTYDAATAKFKHVKDPANDEASYASMAITGKVAGKYDWSKYAAGTETLKLKAVFGFKKADGTAVADNPIYSKANGASFAITKSTVAKVEFGADPDNITKAVSGYTFANKVLTLPSGLWAAASAGETRYLKVTGANGTYDILLVTIAD